MEETAVTQTLVEQFKATLGEKDMQILELRMNGDTLEEIAEKLGYKNHSDALFVCLEKLGELANKAGSPELEKEIPTALK